MPCIVVAIKNSKPKILMIGFNFVNQFENELNKHDKFKDISVIADVGDWETDFAITYRDL